MQADKKAKDSGSKDLDECEITTLARWTRIRTVFGTA